MNHDVHDGQFPSDRSKIRTVQLISTTYIPSHRCGLSLDLTRLMTLGEKSPIMWLLSVLPGGELRLFCGELLSVAR